MIKVLMLGLWIAVVTLAGTWAGANFLAGSGEAAAVPEKFFGGLEVVKPRTISVPIIAGGGIQGYVVAQLSFTVKKETLNSLSVKPDVFIVDEAFRAIYSGEKYDMKALKKQDIAALAGQIKDNVNRRFGSPFVEDVLFEELNFVALDKVRGGLKQK